MEVAARDGQAIVVLAIGNAHNEVSQEPSFDRSYGFGGHGVLRRGRGELDPKDVAKVKETGLDEGDPAWGFSAVGANEPGGEGHADVVLIFAFQRESVRYNIEGNLDVNA